jgi:hypothetical protein
VFYVVGNGPSLRKSDIKNFPNNEWLGMNSAYRYWDSIGKYPKFYACLDPVVVQSHAQEILRLHRENLIEEFFLHHDILNEIPQFENDPRVCLLRDFLKPQKRKLPISRFALYKQTTGALATRFCIEKGFENLCLIGIDCNYVELIDEAKSLEGYDLVIDKKVSSNPNYFFDDYQAKGDKYQVPNPKVHSGNLHLQSFIAIANDIATENLDISITVGSTKSMLSKFNLFPTKPIRELMGLRRLECVAIPIIKKEVDTFLENLELWSKPKVSPSLYSRESGTTLHVFLDGSYDQEVFDAISAKIAQLPELQSYFSEFKITFFDFPDSVNFYRKGTPGKVEFCTKSGPNIFFLSVMKHCHQYEYTFQMESDCIPLKAGWLDGADRLIKSDGENAWFHGPNYYGPTDIDSTYDLHINGNGIYATGNNEFQSFLDNEYQTLLKYIISTGVNHMAYDTVISFVVSGNSENVKRATGIDLRKFLPRYRFSDFILNLGGGVETNDSSSFNLLSILNDNQNTYLGHGRLFQKLVPEEYDELQSFYAISNTNSNELAFTSCWFSNAQIKFNALGYGNLDLANFPKSEVNFNIYFNCLDPYKLENKGSHFEFQFSVEMNNLDFSDIRIRIYDSEHKSKEVRCNVTREGNSYSIVTEDLPPSNHVWEIAAISCKAKNTAAASMVRLSNCTGKHRYETTVNYALIDEVKTEGVSVLVDNWQEFILNGQSEINNRHAHIRYSHFKSESFLIQDVSVSNNNVIQMRLMQANESKKYNSESMAVCNFRGCIPKSAGKIRFSVDGLSQGSVLKVLICRQGASKWQQKYIDVPGTVTIDNPFTEYHEGMRVEIRTIIGTLSKSFKLQVEFPETELAPAIVEKNNKLPCEHVSHIEFKTIIGALEADDASLIADALNNKSIQFTQSLIKALNKNDKWKWLVPSVVKAIKPDFAQEILPRIVYFDPVHRNTVSATQELRKSLLKRYPDNLVTLVHPSWEKEGMWEVTIENETNYFTLEDIITDIAESENIKLIVRTGFLGDIGVDLYTQVVNLDCDIYPFIMDTWDLRVKNSTEVGSKNLLDAFKKLLYNSSEVISITQEMASHIKSTYSVDSNFVVHNFIPEHFKLEYKPQINGVAIKKKQKLTYLYSGGLEEDMTYGGLLDFIKEISKAPTLVNKIKFVIKTFNRHQKQALQIDAECKKAGIEYQVICKDIPKIEYNKLVEAADVFFIPYVASKASELYVKNSFPNKFGDYLCHQKPIIYFGPKYAISRIIDELDIKGIYNVGNEQELQSAIFDINDNYDILCNGICKASQHITDLFGEKVHIKRFYNAIN